MKRSMDEREADAKAFFARRVRRSSSPPERAMPPRSKARLRLEWQCYLTLHRVYMQNNDDMVLGVGACGLRMGAAPPPYDRVALECEVESEWVNGYLCQGEVKPIAKARAEPHPRYPHACARTDLRALQRAATVRTSWIMAHFWVSPEHHEIARFDKAVALVERAAQTLSKTADDMRAAALALAAHLGCTAAVLAADARALARLVVVPAVAPARLAPHLCRDELLASRYTLKDAAKGAPRRAFEARVCAVFDWRVGIAGPRYLDRDKIAVTVTGAPQQHVLLMTEQERAEAGAVLLEDLAQTLLTGNEEEAALPQLLMVARAFQGAAMELADAVAAARAAGAH